MGNFNTAKLFGLFVTITIGTTAGILIARQIEPHLQKIIDGMNAEYTAHLSAK